MAKITYPNKSIGDQFFATEATEIKTVVNGLDDAIALKANSSSVNTALLGKLSITGPIYAGSNTGSSLGFGGGWIGFNAKRDEATGIWTTFTDGGVPPHNAGTILFHNIAGLSKGNIFKIIEIPTTSAGDTNQTFTDAQIAGMVNSLGGSSYTDAQAIAANAKYHQEAFTALTIGATTTWTTAGKYVTNRTLTLTQNTTLAFTGLVNGAEGSLVLIQDATGSRTFTLPAGSLPSTALDINTAANSITFIGWKYDGTRIFWTAKKY